MTNIESLMDDETILSVITGYHPDQFAINMFEYINHDHLTYLTVESFGNLCGRLGLKIIDLNRSEHKGGSIQFVVSKNNANFKTQSSVGQLRQREIWINANTAMFTRRIQLEIENIGIRLSNLLEKMKIRHLYGVGASISTTYLCNQFGLNNLLTDLFDDDTNKIGLFAPGTRRSVQSLSRIPTSSESVAMILSWQHSEKLIQRLNELNYQGQIILPLPNPRLLINTSSLS